MATDEERMAGAKSIGDDVLDSCCLPRDFAAAEALALSERFHREECEDLRVRLTILEQAHTSATHEMLARLTAQEARDMFAKRDEAARREVNSVRIKSANTKSEMARLLKAMHAASPVELPKRYECIDGWYDSGAQMEEIADGDWVSWDDYLKLLASRGGSTDA